MTRRLDLEYAQERLERASRHGDLLIELLREILTAIGHLQQDVADLQQERAGQDRAEASL